MTDALAALRAPFPPETIGKLPRITCRDCSQSNARCCDKHNKSKCQGCGNYITSAHIHLDYVGHAEVTDRLLTADPAWSWEPVSFGADGLPALDRNGKGDPTGLWIRLTVCGVTRLGYGSVEGGAFDAVKQLIGDALRNAAMRFGVALDLWSKADLESQREETERPFVAPKPDPKPALDPDVAAILAPLDTITDEAQRKTVKRQFVETFGEPAKLPEEAWVQAREWVGQRVEWHGEVNAGQGILDSGGAS